MIIWAKLINNQAFKIAQFDFLTFTEDKLPIVEQYLDKIAIKIFNLVNIIGPKAIVIECEDEKLQRFLIDSLTKILNNKFYFDELGRGIKILDSLPFYSGKPISLRSKLKRLGQFENKMGVGINIGVDKIQAVCIDGFGNIIKKLEIKTEPEKRYRYVIDRTLNLLEQLLQGIHKEKLLSIGIGIPGGIRPLFVRNMLIFEDWENVNLRKEIENVTEVPVYIENDANVIALGEKEISRIEGDFFTITLGEKGVGGGIIMEDRILRGKNYLAGEIGHIIVDDSENAVICGCGNRGCLEAQILRIANKFDGLTDTRALEEFVYYLFKGIQITVELTGINQVLICSMVSKLDYQFFQTLRDYLKEKIDQPVKVFELFLERMYKENREFVGAIGAAIFGMQKVYEISENAVVLIEDSYDSMGKVAASIIAEQIKRKPSSVIGLATGSTPLSMYKELIHMHKEEGLDLSKIITFNLDEYYPMKASHNQSYHYFMNYWFFNHVNINQENIHIPNGDINEDEIETYCLEYENLIKKYGGIDIQILGIGGGYFDEDGNYCGGHIGFNEVGSDIFSRTRKVKLADKTRVDNSQFFPTIEEVPKYALTMGIATILDSKRIILLASGEHKAEIVRESIENRISQKIPASTLQTHANTMFLIEKSAASALSRNKYPWLFSEIKWINEEENKELDLVKIEQALIWLSRTTNKKINELDLQDFHSNFLSNLLIAFDYNVPKLTSMIMNRIYIKIRYSQNLPRNRRILIISARPGDNAVINEVVKTLVTNENTVKIANITSGNINVKNDDVISYCRANKFNDVIIEKITNKSININELLNLKTLIRKIESIDMHSYLSVPSDDIFFLNLPFYEARSIDERVITELDYQPVVNLLDNYSPEIIFLLESSRDPRGVKAMAVNIIREGINRSKLNNIELWIYKTSMEEYSIPEADIIVPFTEKEMEIKIMSIKQLVSQERPILLGYDSRPLWKRIKLRNESLGKILRTIGLVSTENRYATSFKILKIEKEGISR